MNETCNEYGFQAIPYQIRTVNGYVLTMFRLEDLTTASRVREFTDLIEDDDMVNKPFVDQDESMPESDKTKGNPEVVSDWINQKESDIIPSLKEVVLFQHGLLESSYSWIENGENSLPFLAAKGGYDVWLGNFRGNYYS